MPIKYSVDYQYLPKGRSRPSDDGTAIGIQANDDAGLVILPNVGDFVHIGKSSEYIDFSGRVKTRAFFYQRLSDDSVHCHVNIVVEETDDDWGALIKE